MRSEQGSLPRKRSSHGPGVVGTQTEERKMFFTEMGGIKRSASPEPIADEGEERPDVVSNALLLLRFYSLLTYTCRYASPPVGTTRKHGLKTKGRLLT